MKRLLFALVILASITGFCVFSAIRLAAVHSDLGGALEAAARDASAGDVVAASGRLADIRARWDAERGLLHFLLDREELSAFDAELAAAEAALRAVDVPALGEGCARAAVLIDALLESELPFLRNLL